MSLNNIILDANMLAALYPDSLIDQAPAASAVAETAPLRFLGKNEKNILVLVSHQDAPIIPDQNLDFLYNMLKACRLGAGDIAIVNMASQPGIHPARLMEQFEPKVVLMFDLEPSVLDLPLVFPRYQVQPFNGITYLHAPSLNQIEMDVQAKREIWQALKKIFGV